MQVHDLTNRKSQQNLKNWLIEIINKDGKDVLKGNNASLEDLDTEQFLGICQVHDSLPVIYFLLFVFRSSSMSLKFIIFNSTELKFTDSDLSCWY